MADSKSKGLMHVVLTPVRGPDGEFSLDVCHVEPVGQERAEELMALFAQAAAGEHASCHPGAPCPICSPSQRDAVAAAVRRAMWDA